MKDDPEDLLKQKEKVVFLSDVAQEGRKTPMPFLLVVAIVLALMALFWKTAVRQPDNRQKALQAVIERGKAEEKLIEERVRRQREEYFRKEAERLERLRQRAK